MGHHRHLGPSTALPAETRTNALFLRNQGYIQLQEELSCKVAANLSNL